MTDMGRRVGPGDMKKEDYDVNEDGVVDLVIPHKASHQDGGSDEVNVAGLSGALADEQPSSWAGVSGKPATFTPSAHKAAHQNGGADEVNVAGLSGALADEQLSAWDAVSGKPATFTPAAHKTSHEDGGTDEIDCTGLVGTGGLGILGDGVADRNLRSFLIYLTDGTTADTVKLIKYGEFNDFGVDEENNLAKGGSTTTYTLSADGSELILLTAGFTGTCINVLAVTICRCDTPTLYSVWGLQDATGLKMIFYQFQDGTAMDLANIVDRGHQYIRVLYMTDG